MKRKDRIIRSTSDLQVGDRVHYQPDHYGLTKWENGIVKGIREHTKDAVWVVYSCAGEWDRYQDYTSAKTNINDLYKGWLEEPMTTEQAEQKYLCEHCKEGCDCPYCSCTCLESSTCSMRCKTCNERIWFHGSWGMPDKPEKFNCPYCGAECNPL